MVDKRKEKVTRNAEIVAGGRNKKKPNKNTSVTKNRPKVIKNKSNTGTSVTTKKQNTSITTKKTNKNKFPKLKDATLKNKPTTKKVSTLKRLAKVAGRSLRSPVGKFGIPGALATAAYYGYKEFAGKKKKPVAKKPVAKKKVVAKKRKLSPGESKIRKSDIMGGSKGRLSGPSGPLGSKIDKRKKSTVVKNRNTRFDPKKANRAGQRKGQR